MRVEGTHGCVADGCDRFGCDSGRFDGDVCTNLFDWTHRISINHKTGGEDTCAVQK